MRTLSDVKAEELFDESDDIVELHIAMQMLNNLVIDNGELHPESATVLFMVAERTHQVAERISNDQD